MERMTKAAPARLFILQLSLLTPGLLSNTVFLGPQECSHSLICEQCSPATRSLHIGQISSFTVSSWVLCVHQHRVLVSQMSPVIMSLIELIATMCAAELLYRKLWSLGLSLGLSESCLFYLWHFRDEMCSVRQSWNE